MKTSGLFGVLMLSAAVLAVSCTGDVEYSLAVSPFHQSFVPQLHVQSVGSDMVETGVEAGPDGQQQAATTATYLWQGGRLTKYETAGEPGGDLAERIDYEYDGQGCLSSFVCRTAYAEWEYRFDYTDSLLTAIRYPRGEHEYKVVFTYGKHSDYPIRVQFVEPVDEWMLPAYGVDTLVKSWELEWKDGNLVRARADSMAWYCSGISSIDYYYDHRVNPFVGLFTEHDMADMVLGVPSALSANNMVRRVNNHYYQGQSTPREYTCHYKYDTQGRPKQIVDSWESMYWTTFTRTRHISY